MLYVCIITTPNRRPRLEECLNALRANSYPHTIVLYESEGEGCTASYRNLLSGLAPEALCFILNDDMIVAQDCLAILTNAYLQRFPNKDGVAQPYDIFHDGQIAVSPLATAHILKKYMYHLPYIHSYVDSDLSMNFTKRKLYLYVPNAKVEHKHVLKHPELDDATYRSGSTNKDILSHDWIIFKDRVTKGFPDYPSI